MGLSLFKSITEHARKTIDPNAGLRVKAGRVQLVRVTYKGSKSTVTPLGQWVSIESLVTGRR